MAEVDKMRLSELDAIDRLMTNEINAGRCSVRTSESRFVADLLAARVVTEISNKVVDRLREILQHKDDR